MIAPLFMIFGTCLAVVLFAAAEQARLNQAQDWTELKPRRPLIPWRRWRMQLKLRRFERAYRRKKTTDAKANRLFRELMSEGGTLQ